MLPGRVWFRCENWDSHRLSLPQLHKHLYHFALKPARFLSAFTGPRYLITVYCYITGIVAFPPQDKIPVCFDVPPNHRGLTYRQAS